jgi:hypothetical protein
MPLNVILNPNTALLGAAFRAQPALGAFTERQHQLAIRGAGVIKGTVEFQIYLQHRKWGHSSFRCNNQSATRIHNQYGLLQRNEECPHFQNKK